MPSSKAVVITGASKGIGRALSVAFSRAGWRVFLVARGDEGLQETLGLLDGDLGHIALRCDISKWDECADVASVVAEHGGAAALINDAFGYGEDSLVDTSPETIREFFETSAIGNTQFTKAMLPLLIEQAQQTSQRSKILNIVADWGFPMHNVMSGPAMYVAGKYLMHGLGVALHREVAPSGVDVTNVYPGIVAAELSIDSTLEEVKAEFGDEAIPLSDLAEAILMTVHLQSAVVRHLVLSPENPEYNGE